MRKLLISLLVVARWWIAPFALASCVELPPIEESFASAPVVFTGTVVAVDQGGRVAEVEVETVYKGEVAAVVTMLGGQSLEPNVTTSVDRSFSLGVTYAFFPVNATQPFEDNACTATSPLTPELEAIIQELAGGPGRPPIGTVPPDANSGAATGYVLAALGGALLLAAAAVYTVQRQSPRVEVDGFRLNQGDDQATGPG